MELAKVSSDAARFKKRQLEVNRAVEIIEEITPALKDRGLIFILGELIVDVLKLNGLCVVAVRYAADPVRPHPFIGDTVLCRFSFFCPCGWRGQWPLRSASYRRGTAFSLSLPAARSFLPGFPSRRRNQLFIAVNNVIHLLIEHFLPL